MSRVELISDSLRVDGRKPLELRNFDASIGIISADGSAFLSIGNTKLIVQVNGPKEPRFNKPEKCRLNVSFRISSFASNRKYHRNDKRLLEMASMIKSCFQPVLILDLYARSEIDIHVTVLQADGGLLSTAINATTLAFIDAGIPMIDYVAACTCSFANDNVIIDLNNEEEASECAVITLATLPKSGKVVLLSMESRLHLDNFEDTLKTCQEGCQRVGEKIEEAVLTMA